jgi:hypothetical protein
MDKTAQPVLNGGQTCDQCKFLRDMGPKPDLTHSYICVRMPPLPVGGLMLDAGGMPRVVTNTNFPSMNYPDQNWCGEFRQNPGKRQ